MSKKIILILFGAVLVAGGLYFNNNDPSVPQLTKTPDQKENMVTETKVRKIGKEVQRKRPNKEKKSVTAEELRERIRIVDGKIVGGFQNGHSFTIKEGYAFREEKNEKK